MKLIVYGLASCIAIAFYFIFTPISIDSIYSSVPGHAYPDYPALLNEDQIQAVDEDNPDYYNASFLPAHRTTADGRIAVPTSREDHLDRFYLNVPERIDQTVPFTSPVASAGTSILARVNGEINSRLFSVEDLVNSDRTVHEDTSNNESFSFGQTSICDASMQFPQVDTSPVSCGSDQQPADCYTFLLTTSFSEREKKTGLLGGYGNFKRTTLYGRKVRIVVVNPKTAQARIDQYDWVSEPIRGFEFSYSDPQFTSGNPPMLEPMFSNDGRLLVFRTGMLNMQWSQNDGSMKQGRFNMVYAVAPEDAQPCDITAFNSSHLAPLSHAYYDNSMKSAGLSTGRPRYGIAEYQLRDPMGNFIADGDDLQGTYPWIDREAANIMIETVGADLYSTDNNHAPRFEVKCLPGIECDLYPVTLGKNGDIQWSGKKRGVTIVGRWTRGKMVLLDGLVNNTDFGLGQQKDKQRRIKLYQPRTDLNQSGDGFINAGFGQGINISKAISDQHGIDKNASFIDSFENLFLHFNAFIPYSFRDIAWLVSSGRTTAEVSFDEYIDHHAYIVSEMTAAQAHTHDVEHSTTKPMILFDGFDDATSRYDEPRRVQNASTTTLFEVPKFGTLTGRARIEPIALGGIEGRGIFLHDEKDSIEYIIPNNHSANEWIISVFIDPRIDSGQAPNKNVRRRLITYPDHTQVDLIDKSRLEFSKAGNETLLSVQLYERGNEMETAESGWMHLGIKVKHTNTGSLMSVYVNGLPVIDNAKIKQQLFHMRENVSGKTLALGGGFRGWVDEFKVLAHGGSHEYMCNLAKGTLIGFNQDVEAGWWNESVHYSEVTHQAVSSALPESDRFDKYACFHDYTDLKRAHVLNLPQQATALKNAFHFPEGPLRYGQPRPDSLTSMPGGKANSFCLSCHLADDVAPSMDIANALGYSNLKLEDDPRRQPMQTLRNIYGHIPRNFYSPGTDYGESADIPDKALNEGVKFDAWAYPFDGSERLMPSASTLN